MGQKERQRFYYDKHTKPLQPIHQGDTMRMRLPGQRTWSPGTCMGQVGPRSYEVKVGESIYRRHSRQLVRSNELPIPDTPENRNKLNCPANRPTALYLSNNQPLKVFADHSVYGDRLPA